MKLRTISHAFLVNISPDILIELSQSLENTKYLAKLICFLNHWILLEKTH